MRGKKNRNNKGFTLIEAVVSMLILAVVILSIIGGFNIITNSNYKAKKIQGANTLFSDINEKLRDATDFAEAKEIVENEINGKEFSVGALKYKVEATIDSTAGEKYVIAATATPTPGPDYYYNKIFGYNCYFSPVENNYYIYYHGTKYYFEVKNGKYYFNSHEVSGVTPTPTVAPEKVLVKSYDNYVYEINNEKNPGFPEFDDKKVKAIVLDNTDLDAMNNEYTAEEVNYQNNTVDRANGMNSKCKSYRVAGALGRINDKQIMYKFKKVWYLNSADNKTYVKYLITQAVTYNKGKNTYSSDNFWGYESITNNSDVYLSNGSRITNTAVRELGYFKNFRQILYREGYNPIDYENDFSVLAKYVCFLDGINKVPSYGYRAGKVLNSVSNTTRYSEGEYMYYGDGAETPILGAGITETVLAEGIADSYDSQYGPKSSEAERQLANLDSIYLFYTPYSADEDNVSLTDERYLNMLLFCDDSWDYKKQYNVYFLISNRDSTDVTFTSKGYAMAYWTLQGEEERAKYYPLGSEGLITNVRIEGQSSDVVAAKNSFSRYTGINYAEDGYYNKDFKIVPDSLSHSTIPTKSTGVNIKISYEGNTVLEKEWYLYFK